MAATLVLVEVFQERAEPLTEKASQNKSRDRRFD
jgi:hypothetical protein